MIGGMESIGRGGTWNANGIKLRQPEIAKFLEKQQLDWLVITETQLMHGAVPQLLKQQGRHAGSIWQSRPNNRGRPSGGITFLVRNNLQCKTLLVNRDEEEGRWAILRIGDLEIVATYLSPALSIDKFRETLRSLSTAINQIKGGKFVLIGDFNARCGAVTGDSTLDERGEALIEWARIRNLDILNTMPRTERSRSATFSSGSVLDYIITPRLVTNTLVSIEYLDKIFCTGNHHMQVVCEFALEHSTVGVVHVPQRRYKTARRQVKRHDREYRKNFLEEFETTTLDVGKMLRDVETLSPTEVQSIINEANGLIVAAIHGIAERHLGVVQPFSPDLKRNKPHREKRLARNVRALRKKIKRTNDLSEIERLEKEASTEDKKLRASRERRCAGDYRKVLDKVNTSGIRNVISFASRLKRSTTRGKHISIDDLNAGAQHYASQNSPLRLERDNPCPVKMQDGFDSVPFRTELNENDLNTKAALLEYVDTQKVFYAIRGLKRGKAAGPDGVTKELLALGEEPQSCPLTKAIHYLFRAVIQSGCTPSDWGKGHVVPVYKQKGNPRDWNNQRPVTLLSVLRKLFERCIANEFYRKGFNDLQGGFCRNRGTYNQIANFHNTMTAARTHAERYVALLDIQAAYDTVNWNVLWGRCLTKGVHPHMVNLFAQMTFHAKSRVVANGHASAWFPIRSGTPQGGVISSTLFNISFDSLPEELVASGYGVAVQHAEINRQIPASLYADDVIAMSTSKEGMTSLLQICEEHSRRNLYRWKPAKCMILSNVKNAEFYLYGERIAQVDHAIYLGVPVTQDGIDTKRLIERNISKAMDRVGLLHSVGINKTGLRGYYNACIYKLFVRPILEYGLAVAPVDSKLLKKAETAQRNALLALLGGHKYSPILVINKLSEAPLVAPRVHALQAITLSKMYRHKHPLDLDILQATANTPGSLMEYAKTHNHLVQQHLKGITSSGKEIPKLSENEFIQRKNVEYEKSKGVELLGSLPPKCKKSPLRYLEGPLADRRRLIAWWIGTLPGHKRFTCKVCNEPIDKRSRAHVAYCLRTKFPEIYGRNLQPLSDRNGTPRDLITTMIHKAAKFKPYSPGNPHWTPIFEALRRLCSDILKT